MKIKFIEKQNLIRLTKLRHENIAREAIAHIIANMPEPDTSVERMNCGCEIDNCVCIEYAEGT